MTTLVVGLGHPDRGDDAIGLLVVEHVAPEPGVVVRALPGDPARLLDEPAWASADAVVVVDGVRSGAPVGTVRRWAARDLVGPGTSVATGTHGLGLQVTLALADALGRLPDVVDVVGVELADVTLGAAPSPAVLAAVPRAVAEVRARIASEAGGETAGWGRDMGGSPCADTTTTS